MNAGKNVWIDWDGKRIKIDEDPGEGWYPCYPESRVTGDRYTPYPGRTEWERQANAAMASKANANFRRQNSF